jgi:hypothetical protein
VNYNKLVLDLYAYTFNAPYSDTFYVKIRYTVEDAPVGVKLSIRWQQIWVKSTIFKPGNMLIINCVVAIEMASSKEIEKGVNEVFVPYILKEVEAFKRSRSKNTLV